MPAPASRLERRIEFLVGRRLGANVEWVLHDRAGRSPMNFALDAAERALDGDVQVVWVRGGFPELFTLTALEPPIVVFSTRYLELTAYFRGLYMQDWQGEMRTEVARRQFLTLASELALLEHKPDLAVRLFLRAKLGTGVHVVFEDILQELEAAPIDETYMVAWFFGLLHELGHSAPERSKPQGPLLSDESLEAEIQSQLEAFSDALEAELRSLLEEVRTDDRHPLSPAHLRNEVESDIFATGVGLQATLAILQEIGRKEPFDPQVYVAEVYVYLNIITLIQRCRATVRWATSDGEPDPSDVASHLLEPVAIAARLALVRRYLSAAIALYYAGGDPASADTDGWDDLIDTVMSGFETETSEIDSGIGAAMRVILWDTEPLDSLLAVAASELGSNPVFKLEAGPLVARGRSLGLRSEAFAVFAALAS